MNVHTPGPLNTAHGSDIYCGSALIARVFDRGPHGALAERTANALLFSAAPDLLAALHELLDSVHDLTQFDDEMGSVQQARAAIAKAEGKS